MKIKELRAAIRVDQRQLAQRVGVSQAAVSKWERGSEPDGEYLARIARIAAETGELDIADYFRRMNAESSPATIELQNRELASMPQPFDASDHERVGIPLLRDSAAAGIGRRINDADIEDVLHLPYSLCPNPKQTRALRVVGDSMSPILEDGYIVAIDVTVVDPARLYGRMVAARGPDEGVTIKWLRKIENDVLLVPQHTSLRHSPQLISRTSGWKIIGPVLLWIGIPK